MCSWQQKAKSRSATQSSRKGKQWRGPQLQNVPNAKHNKWLNYAKSFLKQSHQFTKLVQWCSYRWTAALSSTVKQRATEMTEPWPRTNCHNLTLVVWAGVASNQRCQPWTAKNKQEECIKHIYNLSYINIYIYTIWLHKYIYLYTQSFWEHGGLLAKLILAKQIIYCKEM